MFKQFPCMTEVKHIISGNGGVELQVHIAQHGVPARVEKLLSSLGWTEVGTDPDTMETLFHKENPTMGGDFDPDLNLYWHWYEAMAYEFGKFIDIGMDSK